MGIKVEVIYPEVTVSEVVGESTAIQVVRPTVSPLPTVASQATVTIVGANVVNNAIVSPTEPPDPYEGMVWIQVPA